MRNNGRDAPNFAFSPKPVGFTAMGSFLFFGATMASLAAITLLWRGTILDRVWVLNPIAFRQLLLIATKAGVLFLLLGVALATAGILWFRRRRWGWKLAVIIIGIQLAGDLVNCVRGDWLRGGTGVIIAGALMVFLLRPGIRTAFS